MAAKILAVENCMLGKLVIETRVVVERSVLESSYIFYHPFYNVFYIPSRDSHVVGASGFALIRLVGTYSAM